MESQMIALIVLNVILIAFNISNIKRTKKVLTEKKVFRFFHVLNKNVIFVGVLVGDKFYVYDQPMSMHLSTYNLKSAEENFQEGYWQLIN